MTQVNGVKSRQFKALFSKHAVIKQSGLFQTRELEHPKEGMDYLSFGESSVKICSHSQTIKIWTA